MPVQQIQQLSCRTIIGHLQNELVASAHTNGVSDLQGMVLVSNNSMRMFPLSL
jgi:hypothetical protein